MSEQLPILRVLTGPTASGKSALGLRLAEEMGWDILCMDSMQIYRGMDIGTAKPTPEERRRVPHHLLDLCDPAETFSVSAWRDAAEEKLHQLRSEGREALLVGGTGLYLQALLHPMAMGNVPADEELRQRLKAEALEPGGREALHRRLEALDPDTAARLPVNDIRRVIRAIEVTETTGIAFSRQPQREEAPRFRCRLVSTRMPREILYQRINRRVVDMEEQGLAGEVSRLLEEGVPEDAQSMQGLGYKEMIPFVKGRCTLDQAIYAVQLGSRHYAKRQITVLKREPEMQYVDVLEPNAYERLRSIMIGENDIDGTKTN